MTRLLTDLGELILPLRGRQAVFRNLALGEIFHSLGQDSRNASRSVGMARLRRAWKAVAP